jgi:hypothetical protein
MKKNLLIIFILLGFTSISQIITTQIGTFEIVKNLNPERNDYYNQSISKSNLENYRLKNKRVTLNFKNGFDIELLSAKELFLKHIEIDLNSYLEDFEKNSNLPLFVVMENGWIGAEISSQTKNSKE